MSPTRAFVFPLVMMITGLAAAVEVGDYPSALDQGYQFLSPRPGAKYLSQQSDIIIRFADEDPNVLDHLTNLETFIQVRGTKGGSYTGQTQIASDGRTVLFNPRTFTYEDTVTVTLQPRWDNSVISPPADISYTFYLNGAQPESPRNIRAIDLISPLGTLKAPSVEKSTSPVRLTAAPVTEPITPQPGRAYIMENGVSVPSNFPHIQITTYDNPDPGLIFLDNRTSGQNSYNVIFDNTGLPLWYWQTDDERRDMKVQPNGVLTMLARNGGMRFIGLNEHYEQVETYRAVNGYDTDEHELTVLEDGSYFLIGRRNETVDMSRYISGGNASVSVRETVIQGFTPAHEMVFQWRAWDNYHPADVHLDNPRGGSFRFPHMNAIQLDRDGHILLSCRHLSEVTKIHRQTGQIIWRLGGGKNSDFVFVNDPLNGFRNQHAISATDPNRYLLFDNGDLHSPQVSRGVEYELDLEAKTATVVWQYPDPATRDVYSHYMGNTQRLPNGNTLINWAVGGLPKLSEIRPDGSKALELNWVDRREAYRVWKCAWEGRALKPHLLTETEADEVLLIYNQFGDPNVAFYRIYGGPTPAPTTVIAETAETLHRLSEGAEGQRIYVRVTSVDGDGVESDFSNETNVIIPKELKPGVNMVVNGDFSQGKAGWTWELQGGDAQWRIEDGVTHYAISDGGSSIYAVQLRQNGMLLQRGKRYVFEFDAWADAPRIIEAKVGQDHGPWTNYSRIGPSYVTPQRRRFVYPFTMNETTDANARVVINTGTSNIDVYLDNVSLKQQ